MSRSNRDAGRTSMAVGFPDIHLVGSLPFPSGSEAFEWIGKALTSWVRRVPDETGDRAGWVVTQTRFFFDNPALATVDPRETGFPAPIPRVTLKEGIDPGDVRFERFGYADAARASYVSFKRGQRQGDLPHDARFLFALPSPVEAVSIFVMPASQAAVLAAYEAETQAAVEEICDAIPHEDLAIQWDCPSHVLIYDGFLPNPYGTIQALSEAIGRWSKFVPEEVELGYHVCWGDRNVGTPAPGTSAELQAGMESLAEEGPIVPLATDATNVAEVANLISSAVDRAIAFMHLPTAFEWVDEVQYSGLADLRLHPETELYVGLVHPQDGIDGARRRVAIVGEQMGRDFGVATPCGMGRFGSHERFDRCVEVLRTVAVERHCGG